MGLYPISADPCLGGAAPAETTVGVRHGSAMVPPEAPQAVRHGPVPALRFALPRPHKLFLLGRQNWAAFIF